MKRYPVWLAVIAMATVVSAPSYAADENGVLPQLFNKTAFPLFSQITDNNTMCTVWYLGPFDTPEYRGAIHRSYIVSAGHCFGRLIRRSENSFQEFAALAAVTTLAKDVLIGVITDLREEEIYFGKWRKPRPDEVAYTTSAILEFGTPAKLQKLTFVGRDPNHKTLLFKGEVPVRHGMSGSPVISEEGELLGMIIRIREENGFLYEVLRPQPSRRRSNSSRTNPCPR